MNLVLNTKILLEDVLLSKTFNELYLQLQPILHINFAGCFISSFTLSIQKLFSIQQRPYRALYRYMLILIKLHLKYFV